ncbi:MAG: DinB family protein [Gemmatimonadaceae bacterium]
MSDRRARRLDVLLQEHDRAVAEFLTRAVAVDSRAWLTPRAEGKWTPAQETQHIILFYNEFLRQLRESTPMRLRSTMIRRIIARLIGLTSILWFERIPVAVRAPREVRPEPITTPATVLLATLRTHVDDFHTLFAATWSSEPRRRMSHHLFGRLSLDQGIRLATVHTRHHAAFLPAPRLS